MSLSNELEEDLQDDDPSGQANLSETTLINSGLQIQTRNVIFPYLISNTVFAEISIKQFDKS